ncbi:MAG: hypothetical protein QOE76_2454 [Frankiales bacterium]|jgi:hypothetical protein|nr:hypothetical protein [Frankiales bacterium]
MTAPGETVRLRLSWRQAGTPSAGLGSMVFIGAILGLLVNRLRGNGLAALIALVIVVLTVLWRRWSWSAEVGPSGLLVRRFLRIRPQPLGPARLVGRASQLRVQVQADGDWLTLPAPRGAGLVGDAGFRTELEKFTTAWNRLGHQVDTAGLAGPGETTTVLRMRIARAWPLLVLGAASLVWQLAVPSMGGDLTAVAIALIVLLQLRQPRPVLARGLWIGDGDRFVEWQDVVSLSVESRRGSRRVVLAGRDFRERLASPVDAWWAPDRGFDRTYQQLRAIWENATATADV